ncbi:hypothetical protein ACWCP6_32300 [Streptomyces sp. NPDC002004]
MKRRIVPLPASVSRGDQLDNARAYGAQHPERSRVLADEQLTDPGELVQACAALSAVPREDRAPVPAESRSRARR